MEDQHHQTVNDESDIEDKEFVADSQNILEKSTNESIGEGLNNTTYVG